MNAITITENHPRWTLYSQLRKCGEITASPDGRHFGLNCIYCSTIFPWTNIKQMLGHLHEKHASELLSTSQYERHRQKNKKRKLCASPSLPVLPERDGTDCASSCREDPLVVVEDQPENVQSFSDSEDDESGITNNSENEDDEDDDLSGCKLDLLLRENHVILSYIIKVHQENSILWDKEHALFQRLHKKLKIYKQMISDIQCRFKITLTYTNIRKAFAGLRKLYTEELRYANKEPTTRLWCFEKLEFLRSRAIADNSELAIPTVQLIPLAEIYQRHPVLWDLNRDESHNRVLQMAEQHQIWHEVNEQLGWNMTFEQFRKHLWRMRKYLRNDRRIRLKCEQDGSEEFKPLHEELYQKLQYLEPFIGPHRCDKCGEEILQFHTYKVHMAAHEGRLPFTCSHCEKGFTHFGKLEIHLRRHSGEKPFACSYCDMRFAASTDLRTHTSLHGSERPYVCHICGLAFRSNSLLYNHNSTAHEPNRFHCPHCPKTYSKKYLLKTHLNWHLQLRCEECRVCGKGFFSRKTMLQHMKLHDVMRFQCAVCDKKFAQLAGLCSHKRLKHKFAGAKSSEQLQEET